MKFCRALLFFHFLFLVHSVLAQSPPNSDSLWKVYADESKSDTDRLKAMHFISWQMTFTNPDSAIGLAKLERGMAEKTGDQKFISDAYNTMGIAFINKGNLTDALDNYLLAYNIRKKMNDLKGLGSSLNNIGIVYYDEGNYDRAIDYYLQSLKIKEQIGDMTGVAACYGNIGQIYSNEHLDEKALNYFRSGLNILDSLHDQRGIESAYGNFATFYGMRKKYKEAKEWTLKSIAIGATLGHKKTIANNFANLGLMYLDLNQPDSAEFYFNKAFAIRQEINDKQGISASEFELGSFEILRKNYKKAISHCLASLNISQEIGYPQQQSSACDCLKQAYEASGNYKEAYHYLEQRILLNDSINNLEKSKSLSRKLMQNEFEKRELRDSLKNAEEIRINKLKSDEAYNTQRTYTVAGGIGFVLMGIIAFILLRGFRQKQKNNILLETKNKVITEQKQEVESQKLLIEEKNEALLDSIHYAERIQKALLPTEKYIDKNIQRLKK